MAEILQQAPHAEANATHHAGDGTPASEPPSLCLGLGSWEDALHIGPEQGAPSLKHAVADAVGESELPKGTTAHKQLDASERRLAYHRG